MRISDWSSDVCSSDLEKSLVYRDVPGAQGADHALVRRRRARRYQRRAYRNRMRCSLRLILSGRVFEIILDKRECLEQTCERALWQRLQCIFTFMVFKCFSRSAEHTSELKSLMRHS